MCELKKRAFECFKLLFFVCFRCAQITIVRSALQRQLPEIVRRRAKVTFCVHCKIGLLDVFVGIVLHFVYLLDLQLIKFVFFKS